MASPRPQPRPDSSAHRAPTADIAGHRHVVEVNEVQVFATGRGADWWTTFLLAYRTTSRITIVDICLGGAICHVACDSRDDAVWLAATMVDEHGLPKSAVKVRVMREDGTR